MDSHNKYGNQIDVQDGEAILGRALNVMQGELTQSSQVREGMPPGSVRQIFDFYEVADAVLPQAPSLRASVTEALQRKTGWALDQDTLNPAVARWLDSKLEACLETIWTSRTFITIRVTRNKISVEGARSHHGHSTGRLPS